jgi:hypothetical protein
MPEAEPAPRPPALTVGRVKSFKRGTFTILTPNGRFQRVGTTPETIAVDARESRDDSVEVGDRVVVKYEPKQGAQASEVLVMLRDQSLGVLVAAVDGDVVETKNHLGLAGRIELAAAPVRRVQPATIEDVVNGSIIYAYLTVSTAGALAAKEIVILPEDTSFGS